MGGDSYTSAWIGDRTGGSEAYVGGNGDPVVGILGSENQEHVTSLGLFFANTLAVAPRPRVVKPAEPPPALPKAAPVAVNPVAPPLPVVGPVIPPPDAAAAPGNPPPVPVPDRSWISLVIFGAVAAPVFLLLLVSVGRKRQRSDPAPAVDRPAPGGGVVLPPVPPCANTAIRECSVRGSGHRPPAFAEVIPAVVPSRAASRKAQKVSRT